MTNIKKLAWRVVVPLVAIGLAGCDFTKPGDGEYWSDAYSWVNFSGTYKSPSGGAVVVLPGTMASGSSNTVTKTVDAETVGVLHGTDGVYAGNLAHYPVVPGSAMFSSMDWTFSDNGSGTLLISSTGGWTGSGHISYANGAWSLNITEGGTSNKGNPITARYQYSFTSTIAGESSDIINVYTLTLMQQGNLVNMTDSNGSQYSGKMGSLSGSNGNGASTTPVNGDQVIAQYQMTGHNNLSGRDVEIVGTLQGDVVISGTSYYLANRTMTGTWSESDGTSLDINGVAGQIVVTTPTTTPTTTGTTTTP